MSSPTSTDAAGSTRPAVAWPAPPPLMDPNRLVWAETVHGGGYTHLVVERGTTLRLTDLEGDACAHLLAFNAHEPFERLNVADTVRVQPEEHLTAGCLLVSDQGRALATITRDTSGRHDPLFGAAALPVEISSDDDAPEAARGGCRELLALAAAKHDLGRRDIAPSIAFFQGVAVDEGGVPRFLGSVGPGASVAIRAELPLVVLIANAAHPLDPRPQFACGRLEVLAWRDAPTTPADPQWSATPEGRRAYASTAAYLAAHQLR